MRLIKKIRSYLIQKSNPLIDRLIKDGLTYMWPTDLNEMKSTLEELKSKNIKGDFLEAGVALGGSAIFIASLKSKQRKLYLFDVFDMIPEPSKEDDQDVHARYEQIQSGKSKGINGNTYYGYENDLITKVKSNFKNYDLDPSDNEIYFVQGKFQESMKIQREVAFAHLDCDWYESVKYCLNEIHPNIVQGGRFLIDDYFHYSGCRKAVDEFLLKFPNEYNKVEKSKLHLIKK